MPILRAASPDPTTDWCWNEQGDKAACRRTAQDVARHAKALAAAHGTAWRRDDAAVQSFGFLPGGASLGG